MDDLFFWLSKYFWVITSPDHLLLFVFTLAVLLSAPSKQNVVSKTERRGRRLLWLSLLLIWSIAIYPIGNLLLLPLEHRFVKTPLPAEEQIAGVIVLGGAARLRGREEQGELETSEAGERVLTMIKLMHVYPNASFIYTGGSGSINTQEIRGADLIEAYLKDLKLNQRVAFERDSRNTYENAVFSLPLLEDKKDSRWILLTSAFHMPRSVGIFRRQGVDVLPYPVDFRSSSRLDFRFALAENLAQLKIPVREWIGLFAYWLTGKTHSLLPAPIAVSAVKVDS